MTEQRQEQEKAAPEAIRLLEAMHLYLQYSDPADAKYPYTCRTAPSPDDAIFAYHDFPSFKKVFNLVIFTQDGKVLTWNEGDTYSIGLKHPVRISDALWCRKTSIYEILLASVLRVIERETFLNIDLCRISPFITFLVYQDALVFLWVCESGHEVTCPVLSKCREINDLLKDPAARFDQESAFLLSSILQLQPKAA